jgi:hypothetical protein
MQGFFPTHGLTHEKALHDGYRFSLAVILGQDNETLTKQIYE